VLASLFSDKITGFASLLFFFNPVNPVILSILFYDA